MKERTLIAISFGCLIIFGFFIGISTAIYFNIAEKYESSLFTLIALIFFMIQALINVKISFNKSEKKIQNY